MNTLTRIRGSQVGLFTVLLCLLVPALQTRAELPVDWQSWTPAEVLASSGTEQWAALTVEQQQQLSDHVWTNFLSDGGDKASIGLADFLQLSDRFHDRLDSTQRTDLSTLASSLIPSSQAELASLGVWDVWRMRRVARTLGVEDATVVMWTRTYLQTSGQMLHEAGSPELGLLMDWANDVESDLGTDMSSTRQAIVKYISDLAAASGSQSAASLYTHARLIGATITKTAKSERSQYAQPVVDLISQNTVAFRDLSLWDLQYLRKVAYRADVDEDLIFDWTIDWAIYGDTWMHGTSYREINTLYDWLFQARSRPRVREAERRLTDYLRDRLMVDPSALAEIDPEGFGLARVVNALVPRLDEAELDRLALFVADRFAELDGLDGHYWDYERVGSLFDTPKLQQALLERVEDPQGSPRVKVAKVITWMHTTSDELDTWRAHTEQKAADPQLTPDQRALWLLVRAEAASPWALPADRSSKLPRVWAEQALAVASDEPTRLECLKWIVDEDLKFNRAAEAEAILTREAAAFKDVKSATEIQDLQREVSKHNGLDDTPKE